MVVSSPSGPVSSFPTTPRIPTTCSGRNPPLVQLPALLAALRGGSDSDDNENDNTNTNTMNTHNTIHEPSTLPQVESLVQQAAMNHQLVVIDFSATWCGPCKAIAPLFQELSQAYNNNKVVFVKIDVDDNPETAAKYNVSAMPTFVFLKQGQVVDRLMGANPERLQELIEEHSQ